MAGVLKRILALPDSLKGQQNDIRILGRMLYPDGCNVKVYYILNNAGSWNTLETTAGNYLPTQTTAHPRRLRSLSTPL
jgi:hypothetical protein